MNQRSISLQQITFYLTIIAAFTGTLVLSFSVGSIHLFPYRFLLIFMWFMFVANIFKNNGRLSLSHIKVKLYLKFFALWMGYAFLSLLWAASKTDAIRNLTFLFIGISIIFFLVYYIRDLNHLKSLYWLWLLIFIALIPVGLWEVTTGAHLWIGLIASIGIFEVLYISISYKIGVFGESEKRVIQNYLSVACRYYRAMRT